ncbi:vWA domain-containing protein [Enterococcus mediterraneensis]|uniref:vWA domain-containing protein n=1 Tax=Enterococcus mediterraneensis TaxID=2364791 RepID=UPI000F04B332|nr:vWA domain-containing protein [Enterococcus mediterraneensis]
MKLAKKWCPAMRILVILTILVPYFSSLAVLLPQDAEAITNEPQVVFNEENYGKVEASYVEKETTIEWTIDYQKYQDTSTNDDVQRLMKLRLEQVASGVGTVKNMNDSDLTEEDDWYVEKEFSAESKGTLIVEMPKDDLELTIEVQMDEQRTTIQEVETAVLAAEVETAETTEAAEPAVQTEEITETVETSDILSSTDAGPHTVTAEVAAEEPQPEAQPEVQATEPAKEAQEESVEAVEPSETATSDAEETEAVISDESAQGRVQTAAWNFNPLLENTGSDATDRFIYTTDDTGTFPENGTGLHLEGGPSKEIVNYDYSSVSEDFVPTTNILEEDSGFYGGYHDYDGAYLKKSVMPTDDPNQFTVQLDMIGDITKSETPLDVVLVLDKSSSMTRDITKIIYGEWEEITWQQYNDRRSGDGYQYQAVRLGWFRYRYERRTRTETTSNRWDDVKNATKQFATELLKNENIQMGLASFGSVGNGNIWGEHSVFANGSGFTNDVDELLANSIYTVTPSNSGTPTFLGVDVGYELLTSSEYKSSNENPQKVMIFLTDGQPTFGPRTRYTGLSQLSKTTDSGNIRYTTNDSLRLYEGDGSDTQGNTTLNRIATNTVTHAGSRRKENIQTYSIGYADTTISVNVLTALGEHGYYRAENFTTLIEVLNNILSKLTATIQNATFIDPMSIFVERISDITTAALTLHKGNPNTLSVTPKGTTEDGYPLYAQHIDDTLTESEDGSINLSDITLGGTETELQGYRITYTVELIDKHRDGKFYPTNGPTYLQNGDEKFLHFAVPSVKVAPPEVDFTLTKMVTNTTSILAGAGFTLYEDQERKNPVEGQSEVESDSYGKIYFTNVKPGTYWLHETTTPLGFETMDPIEITVNSDGTITSDGIKDNKIFNELKPFRLRLDKVTQTGASLSGATFRLDEVAETTKEVETVISDEDGNILFTKDLSPGSYKLTETKAPDGYQISENSPWTIEISADRTATIQGKNETTEQELSVEFDTVNGVWQIAPGESSGKISNDLKPFDLSIKKVSSVNEVVLLPGAKFSLYADSSASGTLLATATTDAYGIGSFIKNDGSGEKFPLASNSIYYIKETKAPDGFILLDGIFTVEVNKYDSVTVSYGTTNLDKDAVAVGLVAGEDNNTIQFTAENRPKGQLPSTGGPGRKSSMIAAAVLIVFATGTTVYYVYRNRKGAK